MARNTKPGDALYFMKRVSEKVDLAFTLSDSGKAEKNLDFADRRLSEMDELIDQQRVEPTEIAYLAEQYELSRRAATNYLEGSGGDVSMSEFSAELSELEEKEIDLASRIETLAGAEGVMEPAAGAKVTVRDSDGNPSVDGRKSVTKKADSEGRVEYDLRLETPKDRESLEAVIELDGRKQWLPLYAGDGEGETEDGSFRVEVHPVVSNVSADSETEFALKLEGKGGAEVSNATVRVEDRTGRGRINGRSGPVTVQADSNGRFDIEFEKTSAQSMSRIEVGVRDDGRWKSMGDVLTLGTLEVDGSEGRLEANEGFDVSCSPELSSLGEGKQTVTLTVRKKYEKLTDYVK
jgi:hypothetical protein